MWIDFCCYIVILLLSFFWGISVWIMNYALFMQEISLRDLTSNYAVLWCQLIKIIYIFKDVSVYFGVALCRIKSTARYIRVQTGWNVVHADLSCCDEITVHLISFPLALSRNWIINDYCTAYLGRNDLLGYATYWSPSILHLNIFLLFASELHQPHVVPNPNLNAFLSYIKHKIYIYFLNLSVSESALEKSNI